MNNPEKPVTDFNIAIIILAAGSSSRLGKPKQLLPYQNQTLIKHSVKTALQTFAKAVVVVTGFLHEELVGEIGSEITKIVHNPDWQEGMGSSIRTGIKSLKQLNNFLQFDAVLVMLCDQPLIAAEHLNQLITQFYGDKRSMITATSYAETQGVPAIFDKSLFATLEVLPGNRGAQWLFKNHQEQLDCVAFEGAVVDVDTEEDYLKLIHLSQ